MKRNLILLTLILVSFYSCQNPEKEAMKTIDNFFNEIYNNGADKYNGSLKKSREVLNYSFVSIEMEKLIRNNYINVPEKGTYKLTSVKKSESCYVITSIGKCEGILGMTVTMTSQFIVSKINNEWRISDAYNLIGFNLNFEIEDTQWETYWDIKKINILKEVTDSLKLEVINNGYRSYFGDAMKGNLRLFNHSNYDIKGIEVLIEHFDKNGVSVNTDKVTVWDIVRSKGYREFNWYTSDCAKCVTQKFKINFVRETIK